MYKIAIADDVEDSREFLYYLLCDLYSVVKCEGGEELLRSMRRDPPDLVLMDISLNDMDGIEVLRAIRSDTLLAAIPVVAITAHAMSGDREKYLTAGFDEYISKPIMDVDILFKAIARRLPS